MFEATVDRLGPDELHIPPDVFILALDDVDFGGEQPAAA